MLKAILAGAGFSIGFGLGDRAALDIVRPAQTGAVFGGVVYLTARYPIHRAGHRLRGSCGLDGGLGCGGRRWGGTGGRSSTGLLGGQKLRLDENLLRVVEDGGHLGPGGVPLGVQHPTVAVDNLMGSGPLHGLDRIGRSLSSVGKTVVHIVSIGCVVSGALCVLIQDHSRLLPSDGGGGVEFPVIHAADNAVLRGPVDSAGVVRRGRHITKAGAGVLGNVNAGHIGQDGDKHSPVHSDVRAEFRVADTGEQPGVHCVFHVGIEPIALFHIGELLHIGSRGRQHQPGHQQGGGQKQRCELLFHFRFLVSLDRIRVQSC